MPIELGRLSPIALRDIWENARVLIGNQLERADPEHLGKILRRVYNGVHYEKVGFLSLSIATIAIGMCQRCKDVR